MCCFSHRDRKIHSAIKIRNTNETKKNMPFVDNCKGISVLIEKSRGTFLAELGPVSSPCYHGSVWDFVRNSKSLSIIDPGCGLSLFGFPL